jgi:hypothetical protein
MSHPPVAVFGQASSASQEQAYIDQQTVDSDNHKETSIQDSKDQAQSVASTSKVVGRFLSFIARSLPGSGYQKDNKVGEEEEEDEGWVYGFNL